MLQFSNVYFKYDRRTSLFEDLSFTVHTGHKVGVVGKNGVGKSTVFELIQGRLLPDEGDVILPRTWRIAWLDQQKPPSARPALEFVMDGDSVVRNIERRIKQAIDRGEDALLGRLYTELEDADGYQLEAKAGSILSGLGFSPTEFEKPHKEFSGGWRIRLNLAQTLMMRSDLLLLDEPTNHLDLETTVWLQRWVERSSSTVMMIAHDRDFLDRTAHAIVHLEHYQATTYSGGYSAFEASRTDTLRQREVMYERQQKERQRIESFVNRFRAKSSKARQVQSRIKMLERMNLVAPAQAQRQFNFRFDTPARFDEPMVQLNNASLGYDGQAVVSDVTQRIYPNDRIGVLGWNGAGKSTLLKTLAGVIEIVDGELDVSERTTVGYFAQHQLEDLNPERNAFEHVTELRDFTEQATRNYLGLWGFGADHIFRKVATFSGGEKARLVLAKIALGKPALLVLDEPTNHLDIDVRGALATAMDSFGGAIVVVAHDRHLLRQCVNDFWIVRDGRVSVFDGDLDQYEAVVDDESERVAPATRSNAKQRRVDRARERESKQKLMKRLKTVERDLNQTQQETDDMVERLSDPEIFEKSEPKQLNKLIEQHGRNKKKINQLEREWIELTEELERDKHLD